MWDYTDAVKEHFIHPKNVGEIENPDGVGNVGSISCGDALRLTIKVDRATEVITDAKFKTFGCASAIAFSSMLTEMIIGMKLEDAEKLSNDDIARALGGLPKEKIFFSISMKRNRILQRRKHMHIISRLTVKNVPRYFSFQ